MAIQILKGRHNSGTTPSYVLACRRVLTHYCARENLLLCTVFIDQKAQRVFRQPASMPLTHVVTFLGGVDVAKMP